MSLPRLRVAFLRPAPLLTVLAIFAYSPSSLPAQSVPSAPAPQAAPVPALPPAVHLQDYSKPRSAFPHILQPYQSQEVAQPSSANSPRNHSLMHDCKINL